ncbi:MAG: DUF3592 domain-containing protein [Clostridia bacterium]|nr:DUF3592 domain-containing protein [Clostridia bacterium]
MDEMTYKMLLFFGVMSLGGWFLLFAGLLQRRDSRRRSEQEYTETTGVIVDYVLKKMSTGGGRRFQYWCPVIEFTIGWQNYRLQYENHMNREKFPIGETVGILYDINDPTHFHLDSDPVFTDPGGGAIRFALVWFLICAVTTIFFAVFVGGATFDFTRMWYRLKRAFMRY